MTEEEKKNKKIIQQLTSGDEGVVLRTLGEIRKTGNAALIPAILNTYKNSTSGNIQDRTLNLVRDIKYQEAAEPLVSEIFKIEDVQKQKELISACWQSGLDFSQLLSPFIEVVLTREYSTALEAFSVIENSLHNLKVSELLGHKETLQSRLNQCDALTQPLVRQLIMIIDDIAGSAG